MDSPSKVEILTSDVQSEVDSRTGCCQTETHDNEDGGVRGDTHQHPKHHRQGQRGQQSLGPAEPAGKQIKHIHFLKDFSNVSLVRPQRH